MNKCTFTIKSGKRKDQICEKLTVVGLEYCKTHQNTKRKQVDNDAHVDTLETLKLKLKQVDTLPHNYNIILKRLKYVELIPITSNEYQKNITWLQHALNFPFNTIKKIPVTINHPDLSDYISKIYTNLNSYIHGLETVKEELMAFVCKRISNPYSNNHILSLQGGNGVGKTRLAHGLAEALDLPIKTINLGCISDVSYLTGHNFTYVDSEPGRIVQIINETKFKNCIIYFDELDKIHQTPKGQTINAFLTHLIDSTQNSKYQDIYLSGLELDLSKVFFVFSFNDENLIDKTVKDRLKIINIPPVEIKDQIEITKKFIIPEICNNLNFNYNIPEQTIVEIVKKYRSPNNGLRFIKRIFDDILSKLNLLLMLNENERKNLSFYDSDILFCISNILKKNTSFSEPEQLSYYM